MGYLLYFFRKITYGGKYKAESICDTKIKLINANFNLNKKWNK